VPAGAVDPSGSQGLAYLHAHGHAAAVLNCRAVATVVAVWRSHNRTCALRSRAAPATVPETYPPGWPRSTAWPRSRRAGNLLLELRRSNITPLTLFPGVEGLATSVWHIAYVPSLRPQAVPGAGEEYFDPLA
jgi:hypothetical protein